MNYFNDNEGLRDKPTLNPELWGPDNQLHPHIEADIMRIVKKFIVNLGITIDQVSDIRLIGGMASYNYTNTSDLDITVMIDRNAGYDKKKIRQMGIKASELNYRLRPMISDIEANLYISSANIGSLRPCKQSVYSLAQSDWIMGPTRYEETHKNYITAKANAIIELLESCLSDSSIESSRCEEALLKYLKKFRAKGLASKDGEFSQQNMIWRLLSRSGYIEKLKSKVKQLENDAKFSGGVELLSSGELRALVRQSGGLDDMPTSIVRLNTSILKGGSSDEYIRRAKRILDVFRYDEVTF